MEQEFFATFLDEAVEVLQRWESTCLELDSNPSTELLNDLFRSAHNLKGSARSVGLLDFGNFVHKVEDLITKLKVGELKPSAAIVSTLLDCQSLLTGWISKLADKPEHVENTSALLQEIASHQTSTTSITSNFDASFGFFDDDTGNMESHAKDLGTILIENGYATQTQIEKAVDVQNKKLGQILVDQGVLKSEQVNTALQQQRAAGVKTDETIRVSLRKLDTIIRLIGELSIQHSIVRSAMESAQLATSGTSEAVTLADKVIQDLRSEAMGLRMQPVGSLFQRLERVCRDIAQTQNKEVRVIVKGSDVELDKTVLEAMKDPLVHILRNAVDHGVECSDDRMKSGKSPHATILIEGRQSPSHVSIIVEDDGKGLNEKAILDKAIASKLITPDSALTTAEIHGLIFQPGFSTAAKVTDVSGRGVGMDVVKRAVDNLRGQISISSQTGHGTRMEISLPSTLSILDAVIIDIGGRHYAVPLQDIEEVVHIADSHVENVATSGRIMNLRGKVLPVEKLSAYLPGEESQEENRQGTIAVVATHKETTVAFEVDKILGQQHIVIRKLEDNLEKVPGFSGATILTTGEPSMIVSLPHIVKSYISTFAA